MQNMNNIQKKHNMQKKHSMQNMQNVQKMQNKQNLQSIQRMKNIQKLQDMQNQAYQTKPAKTILRNQIVHLVKAVNARVHIALGNVSNDDLFTQIE